MARALPNRDGRFYAASPIKRGRMTKAQIAELDEAIYAICQAERPLSIRGCFYRVTTRGLVEKTESGYDKVQRRVLMMRRAGELPYGWITDGSRVQYAPTTFDSVDEALSDLSASYRRALWRDQDVQLQIWSEKDAMTGVIYPVTYEWDVPLWVARGYSSETFIYDAAQRVRRVRKPAVIYQLGDHDPSGTGAWVHIQDKLREFAPEIEFVFERLAVTPEQIEQYQLPTRMTKKSDTRAARFEGQSVEVDAMPSPELRRIVREAIEMWIDPEALRLTRAVETGERAALEAFAAGGLIA